MKSRWLRVVLVGTMLLVLASVGVGVSSAQVAPERPNFVVVMTDKVVGSGGADSLYGEDGADTIISKDRVKGNDQLDGGLARIRR